jgi:tripeptidyl-peptidase-1
LKKRTNLKTRQRSSKRVKSTKSSSYPAVNGPAQPLANCDTHITPACIKALYQIPDATSAKSPNSLGMYEASDTYAQEDLDLFYANYAPYIPKGTHPIPAFIDGATAPVSQDKAGGESNVDLEIALSLIYPQTVTLYQTDDTVYFDKLADSAFYGYFNNFLDALDGVSITQKSSRWP